MLNDLQQFIRAADKDFRFIAYADGTRRQTIGKTERVPGTGGQRGQPLRNGRFGFVTPRNGSAGQRQYLNWCLKHQINVHG